jgi:hypothetical protein
MLAASKLSGTGNLEATHSELRQAQTAIYALLADAEINRVDPDGASKKWAGRAALI